MELWKAGDDACVVIKPWQRVRLCFDTRVLDFHIHTGTVKAEMADLIKIIYPYRSAGGAVASAASGHFIRAICFPRIPARAIRVCILSARQSSSRDTLTMALLLSLSKSGRETAELLGLTGIVAGAIRL